MSYHEETTQHQEEHFYRWMEAKGYTFVPAGIQGISEDEPPRFWKNHIIIKVLNYTWNNPKNIYELQTERVS